jgi:hypothetical protein
MAGPKAPLDIRPHSRRGSALAVAVLAAVSASAFAAGFSHQVRRDATVAPFPPAEPARPELIAAAQPEVAPLLPAKLTPPPRRAAVADDAPAAEAAPAESAATDTAAAAPEAPHEIPPSSQPASPPADEPPSV